MPVRSTALLGAFFADHPGPASRASCLAALMERYKISESRAAEWLDHACEAGTLLATEDGISPRDLAPDEAVAHVLAAHPEGLSWKEIAAAVAARQLSPTRVSRTAAQKNERVTPGARGTFRHRRFPAVVAAPATEPITVREATPVVAREATPVARKATPVARKATPPPAVPEPARQMPIVRKRREPAPPPKPSGAHPAVVLDAIDRLISSSTRAIEVQALRERVVDDLAVEVGVDTLRSLVAGNCAELGWHTRGPFVSSREIPWPDLDTVVAVATKGRLRDPAEVVARVRRLLRITDATARALKQKLERSARR